MHSAMSLSTFNFNIRKHTRVLLYPNLWQQFVKEPHIGVMVRCPYTFGSIVYIVAAIHSHSSTSFYFLSCTE